MGVSPSSTCRSSWIRWMAKSPMRLATSWASGGGDPRAASRPYRITRCWHSSFTGQTRAYVKEVPIPAFGAKNFWYRYEFAKSRGQIHFHMCDICAGKQPNMLLHEMRNGAAQDKADPSLLGIGGRCRSPRSTRILGAGGPRRGPRPGAGRNLEAIEGWGRRGSSPPGRSLVPRTPHFLRKHVLLSRVHQLLPPPD